MGRAVGRWDWWNLYREHTPVEWAMQVAAAVVEPFGEMRADHRAALNSVAVMSSMAKLGEDAAKEQVEFLTNYTQHSGQKKAEVSPAQVKRLFGG